MSEKVSVEYTGLPADAAEYPVTELCAMSIELDKYLAARSTTFNGQHAQDPNVVIDDVTTLFGDAVYALRDHAGGSVLAAKPGIVTLWHGLAEHRVAHFASELGNPKVGTTQAPLFLARTTADIVEAFDTLDPFSRCESDFIDKLKFSFNHMIVDDALKLRNYRNLQLSKQQIADFEQERRTQIGDIQINKRRKQLGAAGLLLAGAGIWVYRQLRQR